MRAVSLVSGGIDSPVATKLIADMGIEVIPISFQTTASAKVVTDCIAKMRESTPNVKELIVLSHRQNLEAFTGNCNPKYACVLCKRMMVRTASHLAKELRADFLVTGDSLGQVASQTLRNIAVVEEASSLPIVRPLIGLDKVEIIRVARRLGTLNESVQKQLCCEFVPKMPSTKAVLSVIHEEEKKVDIQALLDATLKK